MRKLMSIGLVMLAATWAAPAAAQDISGRPEVQRFEAFLDSDADLADARLAFLRSVRDLRHPTCSAEPAYERIPIPEMAAYGISWAPVGGLPSFPRSAGEGATGVWAEAYRVDYCGTTIRENASVRVTAEGQEVHWQPPGDTLTDLVLARDLVRRLLVQGLAMGTRATGPCEEIPNPIALIRNTVVVGTWSPNSAWTEHWTLERCGVTDVMAIRLTPSPRGGTDYVISTADRGTSSQRPTPQSRPQPQPRPSVSKPGQQNVQSNQNEPDRPLYEDEDEEDMFD